MDPELPADSITKKQQIDTCLSQQGISSQAGDMFVEEPSEDLFCPVTLCLLLQPRLTLCCGKHLSREAAKMIQGDGKPCPLCRKENFTTVLNKDFQRRVLVQRVICYHKESGCGWDGELTEYFHHIQSEHKGELPMSILPVITNVAPKDCVGHVKLMQAVFGGNKHEVESLLSKGADPNAFPIMINFSPLMEASKAGNADIACLLLRKGANPNLANDEGQTALIVATANDQRGIVDILLENGANPDMQTNEGWTALMEAVYKHRNHIAMRIIAAGATPHIQNKNYTNALLLAIANDEQEEVVDALLDRVDRPFQLDIQDSHGDTVLILACKKRNLNLVKQLLSKKANPNLRNNDGETPFKIAIELGEKDILLELVDNGATVEETNTESLLNEGSPPMTDSPKLHMEGEIVVAGVPLLKKQSLTCKPP